jgi:hypothetical protein
MELFSKKTALQVKLSCAKQAHSMWGEFNCMKKAVWCWRRRPTSPSLHLSCLDQIPSSFSRRRSHTSWKLIKLVDSPSRLVGFSMTFFFQKTSRFWWKIYVGRTIIVLHEWKFREKIAPTDTIFTPYRSEGSAEFRTDRVSLGQLLGLGSSQQARLGWCW